MTSRPTLLFISPQFLFPLDAGGKIRSANILKNLKGGAFNIRLLMPAREDDAARWRAEIETLADDATLWRPTKRGAVWRARRISGFLGGSPISAFSDADGRAKSAVKSALDRAPELVVFDYAQSLAMAPREIPSTVAFFAHNVETEILERHAAAAAVPMKYVWSRESAKMRRYERRACETCDGVIAVSERDRETFERDFGAKRSYAIPTGVDSNYFSFSPPDDNAPPKIVFTGSLDWKANEDGLRWFMDDIWPLIAAKRADASFLAIGKNPPRALVDRARVKRLNWRFTGFVEDIRPHAKGAAFVAPLQVGGGTRIKAFEAMAMGLPVVSTRLGVEGLEVSPDQHLLVADDPAAFAEAVLRLLNEPALRRRLANAARMLVEADFSHRAAARAFETHCLSILDGAR